jgi:UPF0176 protein
MDYQILLYYRFCAIEDPEAVRDAQENLCEQLNLKGRILIAGEGINGTVSGLKADTEAYMACMQEDPLFRGIEFKIDPFDRHAFLKLHVRVKDEIVRFEVEGIRPWDKTAPYIEPEAFRDVLKQAETDENILILDARSKYEHEVGKFRNALTLDIENFRDLPDQVETLKAYRDKTIYTYCTGGIKCEKVSAWLIDQGFEKVFQLHGGIINYAHRAGGEDFEGSCYVFDQRVVVPVNAVNPSTIGTCTVCGEAKTEKMINCANPDCNAHFLICEDCADRLEGCCSEDCHHSPKRRKYDGTGYYLRGVNSKDFVLETDNEPA